MFFEMANYWIFPVAIAAIYIAITNFTQNNIGGKGRMKVLQQEMKELQKKMTDAAKDKREGELNDAISQNWKLTSEIMQIQLKMFAVLIVMLLSLAYIFPFFEPGTSDDVKLQLFDDGLASHCDAKSGDGVFSNCYKLLSSAVKGAWVADFYLRSESGDQLARFAAPLYYDGGKPEDIWLQSASQNSWLDGLTGKTAYALNVSSGKQNYTAGETISLSAFATPSAPAGAKFESVLDSGTFFHVDLPFAIPLLNIRRIIGSYGLFIFSAFLLSISYSIAKSVYGSISKKLKVN